MEKKNLVTELGLNVKIAIILLLGQMDFHELVDFEEKKTVDIKYLILLS